ncbi:MAG TPA: hypothetical protein DCM86_14900 [Verrucomicrobiales bacterium]|nr:hypothetical protein [Verrucomicrobiales bacterium]
MNLPTSLPTSRRRFFTGIARSLGWASLGGFAVAQDLKRRRLQGDPNCIRLYTCTECAEFRGCTKPKAVEARAEAEGPSSSAR